MKGIENPWGQNLALAKSIFSRLGLDLPPLVVLVATDQDFPMDAELKYQVGKYISVADRSLRIGKIVDQYDMPLVLGFGSKIWEKGILSVPGRVSRTTEHELVHFLTVLYLMGQSALDMNVISDKNDLPYKQAFGLPIWEGIADILGNKLGHIIAEQQMIDKGLFIIDDERSFLIAPDRKLGEVAQSVNQILVGVLFRLWEGENINGIVFDKQRNREATIAFLERCYGRLSDVDQNDPDGTLVQKIFAEDNFNWQNAIKSIRVLDESQIERLLIPLSTDDSSRKVMEVWKAKWRDNGKRWDPFGEDEWKKT